MQATTRRIGAHLPLGTGMVKAANRAAEIGADAIQMFSDNPTAWRRRAKPPKELPAFRERLAALGIGPLAIHASYLINLAGPDEEFHEKSVGVLAHELQAAQAYGASFVNVHIGSHRGTGPDAGAARAAETIARALDLAGPDAPDPILALENSAGGGFGMGGRIEELALILAAIDARGLPAERIALCLDTAHLWGAGYDLSTVASVGAFLDAFDAGVGLRRLAMIHLNDSRAELGSQMDRHQHVGAGRIGAAGMAAVLTAPRLLSVPVYLETPGMDEGYDAVNIARCRDLLAGRPLADLPPEALTMPGSRSLSAPPREPGDEEEHEPGRRAPRRPTTRPTDGAGPADGTGPTDGAGATEGARPARITKAVDGSTASRGTGASKQAER